MLHNVILFLSTLFLQFHWLPDLFPSTSIIISGGDPAIQIDNVYLTNCAGTITSTALTGSNNMYEITLSHLSQVGINNNYLGMGDCFGVIIEFTLGCSTNENIQLPSIELLGQTYCGEPKNITAYFSQPVPWSHVTNCIDCYKIEKTANPLVVEQGEQVVYTITITSYNQPGSSSNIEISDVLPPGGYFITTLNNIPSGFFTFTTNTLLDFQTYTLEGFYNCDINFVPGKYTNTAKLTNSGTPPETKTASAEVEVNSNCTCNLPHFIIGTDENSLNSMATINQADINAATDITVNGTLFIDMGNISGSEYSIAGKTFHMKRGAKIICNPGFNFYVYGCTFQPCLRMWRGIEISSQSIFRASETDIKGAEIGVLGHPRSNLILSFCNFEDNRIGISLPPLWCSNGAWSYKCDNWTGLRLDSCLFYGTGTMPMAYPGQMTALGNIPFAGIYADYSMINISPQFYTNSFFNMSNGVIGLSSDITAYECTYENIQPDGVYHSLTKAMGTGNYFNGSGIYTYGVVANRTLRQQGFGKITPTSTPLPSFTNCRFGIYADKMNVLSSSNNMQDMTQGYRVTFGNHRSLTVANNTIVSRQTGIEMLLNDGSANTVVDNNDITFGSISLQPAYGIRVEETGGANTHSVVNNNTINHAISALNGHTGIFVQGARNYQVIGNYVYMNDNDLNISGIATNGGDLNTISCNYIYGLAGNTFTNANQSGIRTELGNDIVLGCNNLFDTYNGIYIIGQITGANSSIETNQFNRHYYGFHIGLNSGITQQDRKGNIWNVVPPPGLLQAFHENFNNIPNLVYGPPFGINHFPTKQFPINFFGPTLIPPDLDCNYPTNYCNQFTAASQIITPIDGDIARDSIINDPYTDETRWMLKSDLYRRIDDNPVLQADSLMNAFYNDMAATPAAYFKIIKEATDSLNVNASNSYMTLYDSLLTVYGDSLHNLLLMASDSAYYFSNYSSLMNQIEDVKNILLTNRTSADSIIKAQDAVIHGAVTSLRADNNIVLTTAGIEDNEQIINDIALHLILSNQADFDNLQLNNLYAIASQCPLSGGNSVFRARALYALVDNTIQFDDRQLCNQVGIQFRNAPSDKTVEATCRLFPNPAGDYFTLIYHTEEACNAILDIVNLYGATIHTDRLDVKRHQFVVSTQTLPAGIYLCRVKCDEKLLLSEKLIIIH